MGGHKSTKPGWECLRIVVRLQADCRENAADWQEKVAEWEIGLSSEGGDGGCDSVELGLSEDGGSRL